MKAIAQNRYGDADVLTLRDIDPPKPGAGEVLVQVKAAGADPGVWHMMTGVPYLMRVIGFGFRRPKVPVRGLALAGIVQSAGPGVTRFRQGDEVFGTCRSGSFAEYATAREDRLAPKPQKLTFEQAAALPVSAVTALQAVREANVQALTVGLAEHGHGGDVQLAAGADDPQRDLAAVRDEDFLEHVGPSLVASGPS